MYIKTKSDRLDNRSTFTQNIAGNTAVTNPTVDTNTNRFVTSGTNFQYDLNGNLTRDSESRQFTFNGDNKQTVVRDAASNIIGQYFFDGEGKRVKKKVYDPNNPAVITEETIFVYSSGKLVAEYSTQLSQSPTTSYTTTDHLGSPRVITDQLGQVKSRRDFMPFGEELNTNVGNRSASSGYGSIDNVRQKFTGYQMDSETNLDFAEARMYENRHGRFTAIDPLLASGKSINPQTFNRYVYVGNNPIILTDPLGLDWFFNKATSRYEWSQDNKTLATGEEIDSNWELVRDHIYPGVGEGVGWVVLDPKQRDWATGFESREDALQFLDPGQNVSLYDGVDEMMTVFDAVTLIGGVARRGTKIVVEEGAEFLAERLIKKTMSQVLRESAEKELRAAGKAVTTQSLNRVQGLLAERFVERQLIRDGYEVLGSQVTARLANGDLRFIDKLVKSPTGEIFGVEVKSGGSIYSKTQEAKDAFIQSSGAVLGNNAPLTLQGQTMKFRMELRRVE